MTAGSSSLSFLDHLDGSTIDAIVIAVDNHTIAVNRAIARDRRAEEDEVMHFSSHKAAIVTGEEDQRVLRERLARVMIQLIK